MVDIGRWSLQWVRICLQWIGWDQNKATNIGERWICRGGPLERLYCTCTVYLQYNCTHSIPTSHPQLVHQRLWYVLYCLWRNYPSEFITLDFFFLNSLWVCRFTIKEWDIRKDRQVPEGSGEQGQTGETRLQNHLWFPPKPLAIKVSIDEDDSW